MLTNIKSNAATMINSIETMLEQLQIEVDKEADELKARYYTEKQELYEQEVDRLTAKLGDKEKAIKRAYAPLNFTVRAEDDRLELSWFTRHGATKGKISGEKGAIIKHRVPWGAARNKERPGYYMPNLVRYAKGWDTDLVRRTESHAVTIREARKMLLEFRERLKMFRRILDRKYPVATNPDAPLGASPLAQPEEHPLIVPTPQRSLPTTKSCGENEADEPDPNER